MNRCFLAAFYYSPRDNSNKHCCISHPLSPLGYSNPGTASLVSVVLWQCCWDEREKTWPFLCALIFYCSDSCFKVFPTSTITCLLFFFFSTNSLSLILCACVFVRTQTHAITQTHTIMHTHTHRRSWIPCKMIYIYIYLQQANLLLLANNNQQMVQ